MESTVTRRTNGPAGDPKEPNAESHRTAASQVDARNETRTATRAADGRNTIVLFQVRFSFHAQKLQNSLFEITFS